LLNKLVVDLFGTFLMHSSNKDDSYSLSESNHEFFFMENLEAEIQCKNLIVECS
jgi:hypothetical protein